MDQVDIIVVRPFRIGGVAHEIGERLTVGRIFASELVSYGKAMRAPAEHADDAKKDRKK